MAKRSSDGCGYITEWNPTTKLTAYRNDSKIQIESFHIFCDLEQESKDFGKKTTLEVEFGDFKQTIDDIFRQNAYQRNHIWNFFIALSCGRSEDPRLILSVCLDKEPIEVLEVQIQFIEGDPPPGPLSS